MADANAELENHDEAQLFYCEAIAYGEVEAYERYLDYLIENEYVEDAKTVLTKVLRYRLKQ